MFSISSIASSMMPMQPIAQKAEAPRELAQHVKNTNPVDVFETQDGSVRASRLDNAEREMPIMKQSDQEEFREVFHRFIGTTLYGQMLRSMRQTQSKPAYFDGGRAEELFQQQLDQVLVDKMTRATSKSMSDSMFKQMNRKTLVGQ